MKTLKPTLVLNKSWQAINVINAKDALIKLWTGKAKVIDPNDYSMYEWDDWAKLEPTEEYIRTPYFKLRVPEVIVLTDYDKYPTSGIAFSRKNICLRDKYTCMYCGTQLLRENLTLDHVVPRSKGGKSSWTNCVVSCIDCNFKKRNRTPEEAGMSLLRVPVKPRWIPVLTGGKILTSWEKFISDVYWNTPLEN